MSWLDTQMSKIADWHKRIIDDQAKQMGSFVQSVTNNRTKQMNSLVQSISDDQAKRMTSFVQSVTDDQAKRITSLVQSVTDDRTKQISSFVQSVIDDQTTWINEWTQSFFRHLDAASDAWKIASHEVGPFLKPAGFWLPYSASFTLLNALQSSVANGSTSPEDIRAIFLNFYASEDYIELRAMIEAWEAHIHLSRRMHIIKPALDAHIRGEYVLSVPAILPVIEGVLMDIMGGKAKHISLVNNATDKVTPFLSEVHKDAIIAYLTGETGSVYGTVGNDFTPHSYAAWVVSHGWTEEELLQRHGILHGLHLNYGSESNSLRAFLLLDVLYELS